MITRLIRTRSFQAPRMEFDEKMKRTTFFLAKGGLWLPGRITLNIWRLMRSGTWGTGLKLTSFSLQSVAEAVLGSHLPEYSNLTMTTWWTSGIPSDAQNALCSIASNIQATFAIMVSFTRL